MAGQSPETGARRLKHYGTFGLQRVVKQIVGTWQMRDGVPETVAVRLERLRRDEGRIALALGQPLRGRQVMVVGPGQLLREARFFALHNQVTCLDIDVIPSGMDPRAYLTMLRANGPGRVMKTVGRKLIGNDRLELAEWKRQLGTSRLPEPACLVGDVRDGIPEPGRWDVIASFAVFQTIPDPALAVQRCAEALAPGGVLYVGVQQWGSNIGHHDIRAYVNEEHLLPLWPHLRPRHRHMVEPSAWLNELRLRDWRAVFAACCPGYAEYQERYGEQELRAKMTPALREELAEYDDDELYSVDVFFCWHKPLA